MALPMVIQAEIKNRRIVIEFPEDIADGKVTLTIDRVNAPSRELTRDEIREILAKANLLETDLGIPDDLEYVSDDEIEELGKMSGNPRPAEDLIAEDRGN